MNKEEKNPATKAKTVAGGRPVGELRVTNTSNFLELSRTLNSVEPLYFSGTR